MSKNIRQKTWGIFIKPYIEYGGDNLVHRGSVSIVHPCQNRNGSCTDYAVAKQGDPWMLYKTTTSFVLCREIVKNVMDDLGYSRKDIIVTEIIPIDHIVTPLV